MQYSFLNEICRRRLWMFVAVIMSMSVLTSKAQVIELAVGEGVYLYTPTPEYPYTAIAKGLWDNSEAPNMGFSSIPDDYSAHAGVRSAFSGTQKITCTYTWYRISDRGGRVASPPMTKTWYFKCKGNNEGTTTGELYIIPETLELEVGDTYRMQAWGSGLSSSSDTWSSSNTNIATVTRNAFFDATVTAKSAGQCDISVSVGGLTATCKLTVKSATGISINSENFPDENFLNYLLEQDYGQDGILTDNEINRITEITLTSKNIKSLKGIEFFTALKKLWCIDNPLTSVDVSKNKALEKLSFYYNQLTSLDVSKNTALTYLGCQYNQLTSIDVSKNTALETLECNNNKLTSLDMSMNTALTYLGCQDNQLTSIDVSKNTALTSLWCQDNQLTSIDVLKNKALEKLSCSNNQLTSIDVSKNTALTSLYCDNNQLTALDVSKNTALTYFYCYRNQIKGAAMDAFINSFPFLTNGRRLPFHVIDNTNNDEGNVCTKAQVDKAKFKGWIPYYYNGSEWVVYEGSEDVEPILKGDVNGDGTVNGTDLVALTNMILDKSQKTATSDVNGDGQVNGTDFVTLVNIILGKK